MAFQSRDSVVNLASLLEGHHGRHNSALGNLEPKDVGDSEQVPVHVDQDESEEQQQVKQNEATATSSTTRERESSPPRRAVMMNVKAAGAEGRLSPSSVAAAPLFNPSSEETNNDDDSLSSDIYGPYYDFDPLLQQQNPGKSGNNLLGCLFPWLAKKEVQEEVTEELLSRIERNIQTEKPPVPQQDGEKTVPTTEKSDVPAEIASGTETTEGAICDTTPADKTAPPIPPETLKKEVTTTTTPRKGILKNYSPPEMGPAAKASLRKKRDDAGGQHRTLFTNVYSSSSVKNGTDKRKLQFSPMARVVTVESHKDLPYSEKASVWWSKKDYSDFKHTSRLVTKAMLTKGSEVWILANSSWDTTGSKVSNATGNKNNNKAASEKWWCRFGHSRRGLEHITSPEEGQERSRNTKKSIRSVLKEQRRQKKTGVADPQKIRQVYARASHWSRQLCLASAASDAEAVQHSFEEDRIRDRDFHLRRQNSNNRSLAGISDENSSSNDEEVPQFMKKHLEMTVEAIHDAPSNAELYHKQARSFGVDADATKQKQAAVAVS